MKSMHLVSRSALKGTLAALVIAAGAAGATFAVAQQGSNAGVVVGGVTYTTASVDSVAELKAALKTATNKADVVKLLNLAAQAGLTKANVLDAIQSAKTESSGGTATVLASVETSVNASTASGSTVLTFYEGTAPGGTSTAAIGGNTGNNAASGSVIQTSNNAGGVGTGTSNTTTTNVVYVG